MGSGGRNEPNGIQLARIGEKKFFHELEVHLVLKVRMKRFCAQKARSESNSNKLARIGEKKIFHELEIHHV